jgi:hypothetical protein
MVRSAKPSHSTCGSPPCGFPHDCCTDQAPAQRGGGVLGNSRSKRAGAPRAGIVLARAAAEVVGDDGSLNGRCRSRFDQFPTVPKPAHVAFALSWQPAATDTAASGVGEYPVNAFPLACPHDLMRAPGEGSLRITSIRSPVVLSAHVAGRAVVDGSTANELGPHIASYKFASQ